MRPIIKKPEMTLSRFHNTILPNIPAWTLRILEIYLKHCKHQKTSSHLLIFLDEIGNIKINFPRYSNIITDGSKYKNETGCVAMCNKKRDFHFQYRDLDNKSSTGRQTKIKNICIIF